MSASLGVAAAYDIALRGRLNEMDTVLEKFSASERVNDARAIMFRATKYVLTGDVRGGVALLERAVGRSVEPARSYLVDLLAPLLITSSRTAEAELNLERVSSPATELVPGFIALRAVLAACRGDYTLSRRLASDAILLISTIGRPLLRARVLARCSLAAYYCNDFVNANERGLEAAHLYESAGAFRGAAVAFSVPYSIAHSSSGDAVTARLYARRIVMNGRRAEDMSWVNYGLVAQLDLAVDTGDRRRLDMMRSRLLAKPLHEQYGERFSTVLANVFAAGWAGQFDTARAALTGLCDVRAVSPSRRALCDALVALCVAAMGDSDEARRLVRPVLGRTAGQAKMVPLADTCLRRSARIVAAAICFHHRRHDPRPARPLPRC